MRSLSRMFTSITIMFAGFMLAPAAFALPSSGALQPGSASHVGNTLPSGVALLPGESLAGTEKFSLKGLVKEAGLRIRIGYGHYYPRYYPRRYYGYSYGYYPRYRSRRYYVPYRMKRRYGYRGRGYKIRKLRKRRSHRRHRHNRRNRHLRLRFY